MGETSCLLSKTTPWLYLFLLLISLGPGWSQHMHVPVHDNNIQSAAVRQGAELGSSSHAKNTGMCQYMSL